MANAVLESGSPKVITASTLVKTGRGRLIGVFCAAANATSKLAFCDAVASAASAGAGRFVAPFRVASGNFYRIPVGFGTGLFVSASGSTAALSCTVVYSPDS